LISHCLRQFAGVLGLWAGLGRLGSLTLPTIPVTERKNVKDIEIKQAVIVFYLVLKVSVPKELF
jgi:hypothetical protein